MTNERPILVTYVCVQCEQPCNYVTRFVNTEGNDIWLRVCTDCVLKKVEARRIEVWDQLCKATDPDVRAVLRAEYEHLSMFPVNKGGN